MTQHPVGLSAREATLLASWERERRGRVSLNEIRRAVGSSAKDVARRMVLKGALQRVGRGIYAVRPLRTLSHPSSPSSPVLVAFLLSGKPYYIGALWALSLHRLTTQQYTSRLDVFVTRKHRARALGHATVSFHVLKPAAFRYGIQRVTIEDASVEASDPERTLLDLLDYPEVAGGMLAALNLVKDAVSAVNHEKLIEHAFKGSRFSTCQRLAVLLERTGGSVRTLRKLRGHLEDTSSRLSMVPQLPRRGRLHPVWNVVENDLTSERA